MTEQSIQSTIIKKLSEAGWLVRKIIHCSGSGWPDIEAFKNGAAVHIEVKKQGGRLSEVQKYRIKQLLQHGFDCYVAKSVEDIEHLLNEKP